MKWSKLWIVALSMSTANICSAQFAPQVPLPGNDAVATDDSRIKAWASSCELQRGWLDLADKNLGQATIGTADNAIGAYDDNLVSLGDSGVATLQFAYSIKNAAGPDFAVFENAFANPENDSLAYLELAFVEVSSDGTHFVRFPSICNFQDTLQMDNFVYNYASQVHNLAGKYISGFGTPFDLEDLKDSIGIDISNITHVRIVDVIGSINPNFSTKDSEGKVINNAYPTPYASGGFDLNAVAVLNSNQPVGLDKLTQDVFTVYPNPTKDFIRVISDLYRVSFQIYDVYGRIIQQGFFDKEVLLSLCNVASGCYFLQLQHQNVFKTISIIKQ